MLRNILLVASVMFVQVAWVASQDDCNGFTCPNGFCVPPNWICDGYNDCGDMSDETDCDFKCEEAGGFYCEEDNKCIWADYECDQISDCSSGKDEEDCGYAAQGRKKRSLKEKSTMMLSKMFRKK